MIRRKGNVYKLDTPATTLLLGAGGEQLYYGGRLAVGGCDYEFLRDESEEDALRPFSAFGGEGPFGISCVLEGRAFFPRFVFRRAGLADKCSTRFMASDVFPIPGRAARTIRSEG